MLTLHAHRLSTSSRGLPQTRAMASNSVCCGWDNRGVALGDGKIHLGQLDGRVVALDQSSADRPAVGGGVGSYDAVDRRTNTIAWQPKGRGC